MAENVSHYRPRGAAADLFRHRESEVILSGPAGTGKSTAGLYRVHMACLRHKGIRALIARKTAVTLGSTTLVTFQKNVAAEAIANGDVKFFGGSAREGASFKYANGSIIAVAGMDKPEKILSSEYDIVFVDEATELTETDWETLATRLRHGVLPWQQAIAACNPGPPQHWLKKRAERGVAYMLESRHTDNPYLFDADGKPTARGADYMKKLDALTGVRRLRLRDGVWAAADGLIYNEFDPALHVVDRPGGIEDWRRIWAVDFGYTAPFVWQNWAVDPDGRMWLDREIYMTNRRVDDHAGRILDVVAPGGMWSQRKPDAIVTDHDAEGRATLEHELGMDTTAAHKSVTEGIQAVQRRLVPAGDGRPRLFLCRDALVEADPLLSDTHRPLNCADEFASYVWDSGAGRAIRERPCKENDHSMDALRYATMFLDFGDVPRVRFFDFSGNRW